MAPTDPKSTTPTTPTTRFDDFDPARFEPECLALWHDTGIHRFDPSAPGEIFSVDTPPPYVSAAHLHVGHAMSYSQAEFVVRYQRMRGKNVFYPMGFDDNGLPTERYVETTYGLDKRTTSRAAFRELCLEETRKGAETYKALWTALGLSVDWTLSYSTIDERSRRTSQWSFLDLHRKGRIARAEEPVLWDPRMETALAQADLEHQTRDGTLHTLKFGDATIATTRPELLPACVALYAHPDDDRWRHLYGTRLRTPFSGHEVPVLTDPDVDPSFGTGLMMVCTFGDAMDVQRWRRDQLDTRPLIQPDGRLGGPHAGALAGLSVSKAREAVLAALSAEGALISSTPTKQLVPIAERSGAPVELILRPQWFVKVLDRKEALLERSSQLRWNPPWMKARLDQWIAGLQWDWNISRQRFYGVPFPAWLCAACGEAVLAREEDLPVDPLEDRPPVDACPRCGGELRGDPDVMDTWMTSSVSPRILGFGAPNGRATPMSVRVQAHEIIRTWLFYSLLKTDLHDGQLPWTDVMISGWGLDEHGKKISKRSLEKADASGYNRYEPHAVIRKYGADALRWWAASSHLGHDVRYDEQEVKAGRKLAVKLWNAAKFAEAHLDLSTPAETAAAAGTREPEDEWLLARLDATIRAVTSSFDAWDYAGGREALERFFWADFCDDWLEIAKDRLHRGGPPEAVAAAKATLDRALRTLLGLFAPYVPFVTEAIWQRLYRDRETSADGLAPPSLHRTSFPAPSADATEPDGFDDVLRILGEARTRRTEQRIAQSRQASLATLPTKYADVAGRWPRTARAAARADALEIADDADSVRLTFPT